jgi:ribosome biogenesis GTPase / thiamine phosphate phosphatase
MTTLAGRLVKRHSHFYYVEAEGVLYECMGRGMLKKGGEEPIVGDFVELDSVNPANNTARIQKIQPRTNMLRRPSIANVDGVLVVCSLKEPAFDGVQVDRYLTHVELVGLKPILCVTKSDLAQDAAELDAIRALYAEQLGYDVFFTSYLQPESITVLKTHLEGRVTVLAGPSGSGKSSMLNALNPELQLRVGEVSSKIARGTHTTRHVALLPLSNDDASTLIADTPGFSNLRFDTTLPESVERVYRDFAPYRANCAFSDCLHLNEEGCAVREHLDELAVSRYKSYTTLIGEAREYEETLKATSEKEERGYKVLHRKGQEELYILRLKEKNRDAARNTQKQQVNRQILMEEAEEKSDTAEDSLLDTLNPDGSMDWEAELSGESSE